MRHQSLPYTFFTNNRRKLQAQMPAAAMALVFSNPIAIRNSDQQYVYRQASDIFYLTGITRAESVLLMYATNSQWYEVLFISRPDPATEIWEGHQLTTKEASEISGITDVRFTDSMKYTFEKLITHYPQLLVSRPAHHTVALQWIDHLIKINQNIKQADLHTLIANLRVIKAPEEIDLIKKSITITSKAFENIVQKIEPGIVEYEIEAELIRTFIANGADSHAFDPVIASGINSCTLHYISNNRKMQQGDILLLDFGAEYNGYAADMSRTLPVNRNFSTRQREVYEAVLDIQKKAIALIEPGISIQEINKQVRAMMENKMIDLGLLSAAAIAEQNPDEPLSRQYFMHGTSHFMGIDVHDAGDTKQPLEPGMVLTCEPGLYIREESLGVRIENDILVTEHGAADLMGHIPREPDEIEAMMQ